MTINSLSSRLPEWVKARPANPEEVRKIKLLLRKERLNTVCEAARCPNMGECFGRSTATFLIMGGSCTRNCGFCSVSHDVPAPLDPDEPRRIAEAAGKLKLRHAVITSVTRDDLPDGGAVHFRACIKEIRHLESSPTIEVLTPDFQGNPEAIKTIVEAAPDIFNHNLETVPRLYPQVRPQADFQ
ncbi:MAG: lipoyl synthase, partial [bacterium]